MERIADCFFRNDLIIGPPSSEISHASMHGCRYLLPRSGCRIHAYVHLVGRRRSGWRVGGLL